MNWQLVVCSVSIATNSQIYAMRVLYNLEKLNLKLKIMELKGTIKKIGEIQTFESGFQKRDLVLLTEEQYPQPINIEFLQDKIDLLDGLSQGEQATIAINIRGREWTSAQGEIKYFNSITGWKIVSTESEPIKAKPSEKPRTIEKNVFADDEEDDDLPF